jgi:spore coat polysaccharide biosynthesis protein SpsF (cytidylyltransferase family)
MSKCIFISVRTGSTRLPNKAVLELCNKPSIRWLIDNLKKSKEAEDIILCTTTLKEDDVLCEIATNSDIKYFRGSSEDKLARWLGACEQYGIDFFVNVDGDDLFFDTELADYVMKQYNETDSEFIDGEGLYNDVYGITHSALKRVCEIKGTDETEYIKRYFTEVNEFKVKKLNNIPDRWIKKDIRMTLDYPEDLIFFETVINGIGDKELSFENILNFIEDNPDVKNINFHLDDAWKENQKKIKKLVLKNTT